MLNLKCYSKTHSAVVFLMLNLQCNAKPHWRVVFLMLNLQCNAKPHWPVVFLMLNLQYNAKTHSAVVFLMNLQCYAKTQLVSSEVILKVWWLVQRQVNCSSSYLTSFINLFFTYVLSKRQINSWTYHGPHIHIHRCPISCQKTEWKKYAHTKHGQVCVNCTCCLSVGRGVAR